MHDDILWVEKYRPKTIKDCVLPDNIKSTFTNFVRSGTFPNLILSGGAGSGKTTVAKALCDELDMRYYLLNASENGNIDTLRNNIRNFASTISMNGNRKVVILDEADYLNPNSTQPALRGFIEEFHKNAAFIFTANTRQRIIQPLHSRCTIVDFKIKKSEKQVIGALFMKRLQYILDKEKIPFNQEVIAVLIGKFFPDFRRIINEVQKYSSFGEINEGILAQIEDAKITDLMKGMKEKNFDKIRKWVVQYGEDSQLVFRMIYDSLPLYVTEPSIPAAILKLADYQYKAAWVADQEINTVSCLIELIVDCEFK